MHIASANKDEVLNNLLCQLCRRIDTNTLMLICLSHQEVFAGIESSLILQPSI